MTRPPKIYERFSERRFLRLGGNGAWMSSDHLLLVRTRFLTERYTRLYWGDIQTTLLYSLERPAGLLLAAELFCLSMPLAAAIYLWTTDPLFHVWGLSSTAMFLVGYTYWRLTRFGWACRIQTGTRSARFPIAVTRTGAQRMFEGLRARISAAQGEPDLTLSSLSPVRLNGSEQVRRPQLVLHAIVFVLGIVQALFSFTVGPAGIALSFLIALLYGLGLVGMYFVQQEFDFPFAVRCAAVMSQIMNMIYLAIFILLFGRGGLRAFDHSAANAAAAVQIVFSLFGLTALYTWGLNKPDRQPAMRSVLGLG